MASQNGFSDWRVSSGIGEGLAPALAKKGAVLGLVARREELLCELAEKCERAGGVARAYPADVTDPSAVEEAFQAFIHEFSTIDILIANAGIGGNDESTRDISSRIGQKSRRCKFDGSGQRSAFRAAKDARAGARTIGRDFESGRFSRLATFRRLLGEQGCTDDVL